MILIGPYQNITEKRKKKAEKIPFNDIFYYITLIVICVNQKLERKMC